MHSSDEHVQDAHNSNAKDDTQLSGPENDPQGDSPSWVSDSDEEFVNDDDYTVLVDMLSAQALTNIDTDLPSVNVLGNANSKTVDPSESSFAATNLPRGYPTIEIDRNSPTWQTNLRRQMRKVLTTREIEYWWRQVKPEKPDIEKAAHAALDPESSNSDSEGQVGSKRKRKKSTRDERTRNHVPRQPGVNRTSQTAKQKRDFQEDLTTTDIQMFLAHQKKYTCDGEQLPLYDAQAVCDWMKKYRCSAGKAATRLGFNIHSTIRTLPDEPFSVYDSNGKRLIFNLPGFFSDNVKKGYNEALNTLFKDVKLSTCQADAKGRGRGYSFKSGRYVGCVNMAYAWVPLLRRSGDFKPSSQMVNGGQTTLAKSATAFNSIQNHHYKTRNIGTMVNYALFRCHEDSFWAYLKMSTKLREDVPAAAAVATHEPALSSGK